MTSQKQYPKSTMEDLAKTQVVLKFIVVALDHDRKNVLQISYGLKKDALAKRDHLETLEIYSEVVILIGRTEAKIFSVFPEYRIHT